MFGIMCESDDGNVIVTITPSVVSPEHVVVVVSMKGTILMSNPIPHDVLLIVMRGHLEE